MTRIQIKAFLSLSFFSAMMIVPVESSANPFGSHGSCDSINQASVCLDYTGSYWAEKQDEIILNCEGGGSVAQPVPCPYGVPWESYVIGDCAVGFGQPFEAIMRYYWTGGGGFDAPDFDIDWLKITCEGSGGVWQWGAGAGGPIPEN